MKAMDLYRKRTFGLSLTYSLQERPVQALTCVACAQAILSWLLERFLDFLSSLFFPLFSLSFLSFFGGEIMEPMDIKEHSLETLSEDDKQQENNQQETHEKEIKHFQKIINGCVSYARHCLRHNHKKRHDFHALPERHKELIPTLLDKINQVDDKIVVNGNFLTQLAQGAPLFSDDPKALCLTDKPTTPPNSAEMEKVKSTLKQFVRDWSKEGQGERDATYQPIINALITLYAHKSNTKRGDVRVLVPGAGLGRLAYEIAKHGFSCQGNEYSYYMLLGSNLMLNRVNQEEEYEIYPFIHSFSNIRSSQKQLSPVRIPDVLPGPLPPGTDFSMVAGDFLKIYGQNSVNNDAWDVVVTCFFIDTAHNILQYIEVIHRVLRQGGTWINVGPLLYHYENSVEHSSVELSLEELKHVVCEMGFEFKDEKTISSLYASNPDAMLSYVFNCAFWIATKQSP